MWWRGCGLVFLLQEVHSEYLTLTRTNKSFTRYNFISKMDFFTRDLVTLFSWEKELAYDVYLLQVLRKDRVPSQRVSCLHEEFNLSCLQPERLLTCEAGRRNRKGTMKYPAATCDAEQQHTFQASLVLTFEKLLTEAQKGRNKEGVLAQNAGGMFAVDPLKVLMRSVLNRRTF